MPIQLIRSQGVGLVSHTAFQEEELKQMISRSSAVVTTIIAMTILLPLSGGAIPLWAWQPVAETLLQSDGSWVQPELVSVAKICARQNPAYYVVQDVYRYQSENDNKLIILGRPPLELTKGQTISVEGILNTLPSGERYLSSATAYKFVDAKGRTVKWVSPSFNGTPTWLTKQVLEAPTSPIPPSDPMLDGYPGYVTAAPENEPVKFETVASLTTASPAILTQVKMKAKPIIEIGEGFVILGDDHSKAKVKIFTDNTTLRPTDRVIDLLATVHTTQDGQLALYAGAGESPYFDEQGTDHEGGVFTAHAGTVAYTATLPVNDSSGGAGVMSVNPPGTQNGSWVYLTGQIVSAVGSYRPLESGSPSLNAIPIYYVQGLDRTPGIRVWDTLGAERIGAGYFVDVMAKVTTRDGERILGIPNEADSIEPVVHYNMPSNYVIPKPVFMNNRTLCGGSLGNNPSVTNGVGLYNVGSSVKIAGKVTGKGTYYGGFFGGEEYIQVDDGSSVPSPGTYLAGLGQYNVGSDTGVIVFGDYGSFLDIDINDYVVVTGISSVCPAPDGPEVLNYRSILFPTILEITSGGGSGGNPPVVVTGTVTVDTKVYRRGDEPVTVTYCTEDMRMVSHQITVFNQDNVGEDNFDWTLPKTIDGVTQYHTISAKCDGFKTRVYGNIQPDNSSTYPKFRLVPLTKITLTADDYSISPCGGNNTAILTAKLLDADHQGVYPGVVKFHTDNGTFASDGSILHVIEKNTNSEGVATANLYATYSLNSVNASVKATDDLNTPLPDTTEYNEDAYKYDWQPLMDGLYLTSINIAAYQAQMALSTNKTEISRCDAATITVDLTDCNGGVATDVTITTDLGEFDDHVLGNPRQIVVTTNTSGYAAATLRGAANELGTAHVSAGAYPHGVYTSASLAQSILISEGGLTLTPALYSVPPSTSNVVVTATLTGIVPTGAQVTFTTSAGTLDGSTNPVTKTVNETTHEAQVTLAGISQGGFAVVEASAPELCGQNTKQRVQVDFLQSAADDWPMFMHDVRHQGYSRFNDTNTTENLEFGWSTAVPTTQTARGNWLDTNQYPNEGHPLGGKSSYIFPHPYIDSSPVQADGCPVIVGAWSSGDYSDASTNGYVKAFNPTSGADVWRYPTTGYIGAVASTPCIADIGGVKRVYFGSMNGKVYCLNANTGAALWSQPYQTLNSTGGNGKVLASPIVYNGRVYVGNESATVHCLDASNGTLIWSHTFSRDANWPDRTGVSSVAIGPTATGEIRAYVGCDNGHVYCLSLADSPSQRVIWDYAGEDGLGLGCIESSPTIYAGHVYVGTSWYGGRDFVTLDAEDGTLLWYKGVNEEFRATAAALNGHVFAGEDTGSKFFRLDAATGDTDPNQAPLNPFDAQYNRPAPAGVNNYFVGSAAYISAGFGLVGNDNFALYTLSSTDNSLIRMRGFGGIVCSSPAISYAAQSNYRWVYFLSRVNDGTLYAYRQSLN